MDHFQELLWDLGELIEVPLHVDKNHVCQLILDEKINLHMEVDPSKEFLLVASLVAEIPPGRFREDVLIKALKMNATYHPFGTFSYIEKRNALVLHCYLPIEPLNGEKLLSFLETFVAEAGEWKDAIDGGHPAPATYLRSHSQNPSPYTLPPQNA